MKLTALCYGRTEISERMAFPGGSEERKLPISLLFFLAQGEGRRILIDVGCDTMPGFPLYAHESPVAVLERYGVSRETVTDVIVTHAHHDHMDALRHYPQAKLHIHEEALGRGRKYIPEGMEICSFGERAWVADLEVRYIGGHAPGSSIAVLGQYVLCGDECYTTENLLKRIPTGSSIRPERSRAFIEEYTKPGYMPLLMHDPELVRGLGWREISLSAEKSLRD